MFEELPVDYHGGGDYYDPPANIDDQMPPEWCHICGQRHVGLCQYVYF